MPCTIFRFLRLRSEVKVGLSNDSKTTEVNLMKLHRKIEHNEKVCRTQGFGYYAQGQGHNHVRCLIARKIRSE